MMSTGLLARSVVSRFLLAVMGTLLWIACAPGAQAQVPDRVLAPVNPSEVVALGGHHPAWASPQADVGAVPGDLRLQHLTVLLARSPQEQQAFDEFLQSQQNPASSAYHQWLTPVEVGLRFGVSQHDINAVTDWLRSQGLQVDSVSNSRVLINFSGSAAAVANAFGAGMHYFTVNGEKRISITAEPQIPVALAPVIKSIHGLHTSTLRPASKMGPPRHFTPQSGAPSGNAPTPAIADTNGDHFIAPADFAVIYDVPANVTGASQTIAILGRSRVYNPDIENFQSLTGLATKDPTVIIPPSGVDPGPPAGSGGSASGDQEEQTLDVTRSGSIATGATIDLVVSADTATAFGVDIALQYVVDTTPALAQIVSISYGGCEADNGQSAAAFYDNLFGEAAAAGKSVFVSSGDAGAAGCDASGQTPPAIQTLSPNVLCSSSYVTCVGGTEFNDTSNPSTYWNPTTGAALSYIPEGAWNEPTGTGGFQAAASGGGVSAFIPTPSWQVGTGVPTGAARTGRFTPDVSFSAAGHDAYLVCIAADGGSCVVSGGGFNFISVGGTSAAAPDMAGIAALLNQKLGAQGNLNPVLYKLAAMPANGVFHDVTVASSGVSPCDVNTPSMCNNSTPSPSALTGGLAGFLVGAGYDQATGWGSMDVGNLLTNWTSVVNNFGSTATTLTASVNPVVAGTTVTFSATVTPTGVNAPTGMVTFSDGTTTLGSGMLSTVSGSQVATLATASLALGQHSITATYGGDANNTGSSSAALTENVLSSNPVPVLISLTPSSTNAGGVAFVLTLTGSNFMPNSQVLWNNSSRSTTYFSGGTQLQASITAVDIATGGSATVTVSNPAPGGLSNSLTFSVQELFSGSGGYLSMFVNGANLGNSALYQQAATNYLGFGTANPQYNFQLVVPGEDWLYGGFSLVPAFSGGTNWNTLYGNGGSGFSLIGTAKNKGYPNSRLDMGANSTINFQTGDGSSAPTSKLFVTAAGNVGIGTTAPATALQVFGDARVGNSGTNGCLENFSGAGLIGTCTSDVRLKTNILPFAPVLNKLVLLQPVHFEWNTEANLPYRFGAGRNAGLLAQDVEKVFPEMVSVDGHGFKMVNYSELPYLTLVAVRELKIENDSLRAQLAAMEARLARLEKPRSQGTKKKPATKVRTKQMPVAKPQS